VLLLTTGRQTALALVCRKAWRAIREHHERHGTADPSPSE